MIDFQAIRNELNKISDFIGGEKYIQFKTSDNINVYNKYDLESNNLIVNKEKLLLYQTDTPFTENDLYLLQTYNKIYSVNNTIKHSNIVFAQAKLESANYQSSITKTHNNIFGMRKGNRYRRYNNWQECVKDYKDCIQSRYTGGDYYAFLDKIGYAEDPNYTKKLKQII